VGRKREEVLRDWRIFVIMLVIALRKARWEKRAAICGGDKCTGCLGGGGGEDEGNT
jgi:hypothetical protein